MRRLVVLTLMVAAAAAATLIMGAALGAGSTEAAAEGVHSEHAGHRMAKPSPLAALDRTFQKLVPSARCADGATAAKAAKRRRAGALKGVATAPAKVVAKKKASMRGAIALMRKAVALCEAAAAAPPGTVAAPGTPGAPPAPAPGAPGPAPTPAPPAQTITLHVAPGDTFHYTETSAAAAAGAMRIELHNASNLRHFVAVRTAEGQPTIKESPLSMAGGTTFVDVTLTPGTYQIFCRNMDHDKLGMKIPLTVS